MSAHEDISIANEEASPDLAASMQVMCLSMDFPLFLDQLKTKSRCFE